MRITLGGMAAGIPTRRSDIGNRTSGFAVRDSGLGFGVRHSGFGARSQPSTLNFQPSTFFVSSVPLVTPPPAASSFGFPLNKRSAWRLRALASCLRRAGYSNGKPGERGGGGRRGGRGRCVVRGRCRGRHSRRGRSGGGSTGQRERGASGASAGRAFPRMQKA